MGPFEIWQAAGWKQVARWIAEDIAAGKTLASVPLPPWVSRRSARRAACTRREAPIRAAENVFKPRSALPVYRRQYFPDPVLGEKWPAGTTIIETDARAHVAYRATTSPSSSFKSKQHTIGEDVLDGILAAIAEAEKNWRGLVIWQTQRAVFAAAQTSRRCFRRCRRGKWDQVEAVVAKFQHTSQRLKYSLDSDRCRGARHGARRCVRIHHALRSDGRRAGILYRPGRGGRGAVAGRRRKQGARRACRAGSRARSQRRPARSVPVPAHLFPASGHGDGIEERAGRQRTLVICGRRTSSSSILTSCCGSRKRRCRRLSESAYRPPLPARNIPVAGKTGIATLEMMLVNMRDGGFISAYDFEIGLAIAARALRRRARAGQPGRRELVPRPGAAGVHAPAQEREDAGARSPTRLKTGKPLRN